MGLILFECIFKKLPFGESYDEEQMLKFIDKGINFNALKGINGNEELIEIIKKLLNRTEKYSEFREVILDLSSIMYEKAEIKESLLIEDEQNYKYEKKTKVTKNRNKLLLISAIIIIILSALTTLII